MVRGRGLVFIGITALVVACQVLAGLEDRHVGVVTPVSDAGDAAPLDPCSLLGTPPRPGAQTSSPGDALTITLALSRVDFGLKPDAGVFGLNLDTTCTCPGQDSCRRPPDAGRSCDDDGGIDNAARTIFQKVNLLAPASTEDLANDALAKGLYGALLQVRKYNGKADDSAVDVAVYSSLGTEGSATPLLNGNDKWTIDSTSVKGPNQDAVTVDTGAFVSGGVLVMSIGIPIQISTGSGATLTTITIPLEYSYVAGKLQQSNGVWTLSAVLAGRWVAAKLLGSFSTLNDPNGDPLCGQNVYYQALKNEVCKAVDLPARADQDKSGQPCNALGTGLHFDAVEAKLGTVGVRPPDKDAGCGNNWTDDCPSF